jgi:zinc-ribbon domain
MGDKSYTVGNNIWRTIVICPNCREDNAPNFRFCGMCGTSLEPQRPASRPALDPLSAFPQEAPRKTVAAEPVRQTVPESASRSVSKDAPPITGPSMLGLNQPVADSPGANPTATNEHNVDALRERAFSSFDSFLEPEPKRSGGRVLLLVVLLAALGGSVWWVYSNYLAPSANRKPELASSTTEPDSGEKPSTKSASPDAGAGRSPVAGAFVGSGGSGRTIGKRSGCSGLLSTDCGR